jgi:DegV family protein with EDD domain
MNLRIVTDSTCDLPQEILDQYQIAVIPLYIHIGNQSYRDQIDITREQFYRQLPDYPVPPMTAVPAPEVFERTYRRLIAEGATEILSIHISASLSTIWDQAHAAARAMDEIPITVFDARQLTLGTGYSVLKAAELAAAGTPGDQIVSVLKDQALRTHVFAVTDTLEYLRRSGRVSGLVSGVGNLLRIKPLLKMYDGISDSEKIRTQRKAFARMVELIEGLGALERLDLVHTDAQEQANALYEEIKHLCPPGHSPLTVRVTSVIGAHVGPGCFGVACIQAPIPRP